MTEPTTDLMAALAAWREAKREWDRIPIAVSAERTIEAINRDANIERDLAAAYDAWKAEPTTDRDWHAEIVQGLTRRVLDTWLDQDGNDDELSVAKITVQAILDSLGWPHTYQPDNPHVEAARQSRENDNAA